MDISAAALPPRSPHISAKDRTHPLFPIYDEYRRGMSRLLVEASDFSDWLYRYERDIQFAEIEKHPRMPEFQQWMRDNKGGARRCPAGVFPHNFNFWLEGGRW